ncbi:MAG: hypothetical protein HOC77_07275 [Chloroflexi bacterium]|nr:hypothetical protein [Chloroflexota bacterium]MBT4074691.1 hypothetical protein [Chloroflexota bacterium]MBT4514876.1 hypothetical protein [Chloroflexota bacterium]MBT6681500.1 hypothetical protein [Chloroflexota bacterium]MBT7243798.1 hypothetical protein [Flavobacteriaceae bacterium]
MIHSEPTNSITRAGLAQLTTAAVLATFLSYTTGWRALLVLELGGYMLASGGALVVYGGARRDVPFRKLASTWLPIGIPYLLAFAVLFGVGLALAEDGDNLIGGALLLGGYLALPARSVFRVLAGFRAGSHE